MDTSPPAARSTRAIRIDAARGVAVFGILLVNIWAFVWGFGALRYGVMPDASWADRAAVFAVALLAEQKFYPIFAFLFGAGFALQTRALRKRLPDWPSVRARYRGRLFWLLGWGLLHGLLIWAGDILTVYGLCGFLLLRLAGARLWRIRKAAWLWAAAWLAMMALNVAIALPAPDDDTQQQAIALIDEALASHQVYSAGAPDELADQRIDDYIAVTTGTVFLLPQLMLLFLLGMLAVRLGWLTRPQRHPGLWRRVRALGLCLGLPFNLAWAWVATTEAVNPLDARPYSDLAFALLPVGGMLLAAAYLASVMLAQGRAGEFLWRWMAPVGRMSLTNYLSQSVLCVVLLQTSGLGLGAMAAGKPAMLLELALGVMAFQALASRWWLGRHGRGPLEGLAGRGA